VVRARGGGNVAGRGAGCGRRSPTRSSPAAQHPGSPQQPRTARRPEGGAAHHGAPHLLEVVLEVLPGGAPGQVAHKHLHALAPGARLARLAGRVLAPLALLIAVARAPLALCKGRRAGAGAGASGGRPGGHGVRAGAARRSGGGRRAAASAARGAGRSAPGMVDTLTLICLPSSSEPSSISHARCAVSACCGAGARRGRAQPASRAPAQPARGGGRRAAPRARGRWLAWQGLRRRAPPGTRAAQRSRRARSSLPPGEPAHLILDEAEAPGAAVPADHVGEHHGAGRGEVRVQRVVVGVEAQVAHEQLAAVCGVRRRGRVGALGACGWQAAEGGGGGARARARASQDERAARARGSPLAGPSAGASCSMAAARVLMTARGGQAAWRHARGGWGRAGGRRGTAAPPRPPPSQSRPARRRARRRPRAAPGPGAEPWPRDWRWAAPRDRGARAR
jgi:hypothetical protein